LADSQYFIFTRKVRDMWLKNIRKQFFEQQKLKQAEEAKKANSLKGCVLDSRERCFHCYKPYSK